ncbi:MAG: carboxypeptidase-like regulatory domain-containing protein [Kofleriaceae bacterium]
MHRKLVAAAVAAVGLAVAAWLWLGRTPPTQRGAASAPVATSPNPGAARPAGAAVATTRTAGELARDDDPPGPMRLEGLVLDEHDQPVAGAEVWLTSTPPRTATTETDGSFAFDKLIGRTYTVGARAGDLVGGPMSTRVGPAAEPVVLRLRPGATATVTVHDAADDRPIAGATATLVGAGERSATTDGAGVARFVGVDDGWLAVSVTAEGYAAGAATAMVGTSQRVVDLTVELARGTRVAGVVVDDAGRPVAGAKVWPRDMSSWELVSNQRLAVTTDAKGEFALPAVAPGTYRISAKDDVHAASMSDLITVTDQPTTGVKIVMAAAARIGGFVFAADGQPAPYATVRVSLGPDNGTAEQRSATADERGQFVVAGLPRLPARIRAESELASSTVQTVDLTTQPERADVRLTLDQTGAITGIVVDSAGQPVVEASVSAVPDVLAEERRGTDLALASTTSTTTDGGGRFTLRGLEDGAYRLGASRSGASQRAAWTGDPVIARTGATDVRVVLPAPGGLRGKVALSEGGAPTLAMVSAGWEHRVTTRDGTFELSGMTPGKYDLKVTGADFAERTQGDVVVTAGAITDVGTVTVTAGRKVSGRVVDGKGTPVEGATVLVGKMIFGDGKTTSADPGGQAGLRTATTAASGEFVVRGLGRGDSVVVAEHPAQGRSIAVSLPPGKADVTGLTITLRGYGALIGTVTRKGQPVAGATITATPAGSSGQATFVQAGPDGRFVIDKLPEGKTSVQAMQQQMMSTVSSSVTVAVVAGQQVDASIDIPAGDVNLTAKVEPEPGATVNAAWMLLMRGAFAAVNGRQLMDAFLASQGGGAVGMQIWLGTASFPTFRELVPGSYTLCGIPITGSITDSQLMARVQDNLDKLDAVCKAVKVTAAPTDQTLVVRMPQMKALPAPGEEGGATP